MHSPYATTIRDLGTALRMSTMVTPPKSPALEAIDNAIAQTKAARQGAHSVEEWSNYDTALNKLHEARSLAAGGRS